MSARKYVRFAAPYRSKTFNDKDALLVGRNGVLTGGDVTQSGATVTVQPITLIQSGQIVDIDLPLSVNIPSNLVAPYFIAISISTAIENLAETITPTFVKRPQEVNEKVVLIAEYDGTEWRPLPKLQIKEIINQQADQNVKTDLVGVSSGFDIAQTATEIVIQPGTLISSDGLEVVKDSGFTLLKTPNPSQSIYKRIDNIVFRKPLDSEFRVGMIKYITGPTYSENHPQDLEVALFGNFGASAVSNVQTFNLADGSNLVTWMEGTSVFMQTFSDAFVPGAAHPVATTVDQYCACKDFDGYIDFVYQRGGDLYHTRLSTSGAIIQPQVQLYTSLRTLHDPIIECVGRANDYQLHIAVCRELSGTNREIAYMRLASDQTVITPYTQWINLTTNLMRPTFGKDDDDSLLWLGYEDGDTGRAYLRTYDAASPTPSNAPTQIGTPVELQADVYNMVTHATLPISGATDLKIIRTDNKQLFVFWKHFKGVGQYAVAVYSPTYKATTGFKALVFSDQSIAGFDVCVDGMSNAYVSTVDSTNSILSKQVFALETPVAVTQLDLIESSGTYGSVGNLFSNRGELFTLAANTFNSTSQGKWYETSAGYLSTLRDQDLTPADVYMAYYRTGDGILSVSDTLIGEEPAIKRLYEFNNMFGASGVVSWGKGGATNLITTAITIQFLNRNAVYTLPATAPTGVLIPNGRAIYVEIPDEDVNTTLSYKITKFGQGKLDRVGKKALPLFWNVGGRLFSNFAPYSFSDGETVVIGGTISQELQTWLGISDASPDPTDHDYNSTRFILESDGINTAIGKLDAALGGGFDAITNGQAAAIVPLAVGTTAITVTFSAPRGVNTYRVAAIFENTQDTSPMYQPIMITGKTVNGFTLSWPSPLNTANYLVDFLLRDNA